MSAFNRRASDNFPKVPGLVDLPGWFKAWFILIAALALGTFGGVAFVVYKLLKYFGVL